MNGCERIGYGQVLHSGLATVRASLMAKSLTRELEVTASSVMESSFSGDKLII